MAEPFGLPNLGPVGVETTVAAVATGSIASVASIAELFASVVPGLCGPLFSMPRWSQSARVGMAGALRR